VPFISIAWFMLQVIIEDLIKAVVGDQTSYPRDGICIMYYPISVTRRRRRRRRGEREDTPVTGNVKLKLDLCFHKV
jgi:hypothetical protein